MMGDKAWEQIANDPRHRPVGWVPPVVQELQDRDAREGNSVALVGPSGPLKSTPITQHITPPTQKSKFEMFTMEDDIVIFDEDEEGECSVVAIQRASALNTVWNRLEELLGTTDLKPEDWPELDLKEPLECVIPIPLDCYREKTVAKNGKKFTPLSCVYDSTKEYMGNLLGMSMHHTDKWFFNTHPDTEPGGVSLPFTPKVIQQLIEPYGLRIIRIRVKAGELLLRGDIAEWMQYLGVNPIGAQDFRTSNEEFAKTYGIPAAGLDESFAFEFHEEPLRPSIVCEAKKAHTFTAPSGHASYLAPRSHVGEWWISMQLGKVRDYPWKYPTVPAYPTEYPIEVHREPDMAAILKAVRERIERENAAAAKEGKSADEKSYTARLADGEVR